MVDKGEASGTSEEEAAAIVAPTKTSDERGEDEAHEDDQGKVVLVLPLDNRVVVQVGHVSGTGLAAGLQQHPADYGVNGWKSEDVLKRNVRSQDSR